MVSDRSEAIRPTDIPHDDPELLEKIVELFPRYTVFCAVHFRVRALHQPTLHVDRQTNKDIVQHLFIERFEQSVEIGQLARSEQSEQVEPERDGPVGRGGND